MASPMTEAFLWAVVEGFFPSFGVLNLISFESHLFNDLNRQLFHHYAA